MHNTIDHTIYDLYCGAGGSTVGYHRAGFPNIIGIDNKPQKNYPFKFIQMDALEFLQEIIDDKRERPDAIHTSPPCQRFSAMRTGRWQDREHPDLVEPTRNLLKILNVPYVIENVPGAPLIEPSMLCGSMFRLETSQGNQLRRHRLFETSFTITDVPKCNHNNASVIGVHGGGQHPDRRRVPSIGVYGNSGGSSTRDGKSFFGVDARREAMGIDWMTGKELNQAIPPAYTEFIGKQMFNII